MSATFAEWSVILLCFSMASAIMPPRSGTHAFSMPPTPAEVVPRALRSASHVFTRGFMMALALGACGKGSESAARQSDRAFVAMQARGQTVMGVDQYASTHAFEDLEDGGRIVLDTDSPSDSAGIVAVRQHMRDIAAAFRAGDFAKPFKVHAQEVPGTSVMTARRTEITYEATDRPRGAEVRIRTTDPGVVAAVHEFLRFQRTAHHAAGHEQ